MAIKRLIVGLLKLLLGGFAFFVGLMAGSMIAARMQLPPPPLPEGTNQEVLLTLYIMVSPILAASLALIAIGIAGSWLTRTLILSGFAYVAYTLNNVLDASLFVTAYASTSAFTLISMIVPSLFCGGAVALLFPPRRKDLSFIAAGKEFFSRRNPGQWLWRLPLACIAFMPIYLLFGLLVNPITGAYYRQNMFGLQAAGWSEILPVLFVRSLLFFLASLPIIIVWQESRRRLFLSLGTALFILVGFLYMLISYWLPPILRIPHSLEILADSFVYAGVLTWLLLGRLPLLERKHLVSLS